MRGWLRVITPEDAICSWVKRGDFGAFCTEISTCWIENISR